MPIPSKPELKLSTINDDKSLLANYIKERKGSRVIQRILIANNGLAAVKEIRSVRRWSYNTFGDDKIIKFIVMATPEDISANAEFIRLADEYVDVPGGPNNMNYANVTLIVDVAQRVDAQAVWAGWGHASENPRLPELLDKIGIKFIGPSAVAMHALGDKISSMIVAQSANVPCLPWSGTGITVQPDEDGRIINVNTDVYAKACVISLEEGLKAAELVGYPLMIKASEGGGGKGIRNVDNPGDFAANFDAAQREVPGSPIFLMQLAKEARHLEVQLLADEHGQAIALHGRDCSVQRRHQKIIEEAPVTIVQNYNDWELMEQAAVRLAKMVGYASTGTVEYLYDPINDRFSFLELNPRLQVEHPCTEMISRVNLPACQLQVAMGIPLNCITDVRALFGQNDGTSSISFDLDKKLPPNGHVVACRITAENPDAGFKPGGGKIQELGFRGSDNVWGYFSVSSFGNVHEYSDSQVGHIFAWASSRLEAIQKMVVTLKEITLRADFHTTTEYLIKLLEAEEFLQNTHTTSWLDGLIKSKFGKNKIQKDFAIVSAAAWYAAVEFENRFAAAKDLIAKGQTPAPEHISRSFRIQFIYDQVQYEVNCSQADRDLLSLELCGSKLMAKYLRLKDGGLLVSAFDGQSLLVYGKEDPQGLCITVNGCTIILENEYDPSILKSPSPGKLVRYLVAEGTIVPAGTAIAEIEVMKMYMPLLLNEAGYVTPTKAPGSSLEAGDIIAKVKLLDPSSVTLAKKNDSGFSNIKPVTALAESLNQKYEDNVKSLESVIFEGFPLDLESWNSVTLNFINQALDPRLPFYLVADNLSKAANRLPADIYAELTSLLEKGMHNNGAADCAPLKDCLAILEKLQKGCDSRDLPAINNLISSIKPHLDGPIKFSETVITKLCDRFITESMLFDNAPTMDIILHRLREHFASDFERGTRLFLAWASGENRQIMFGSLLNSFCSKSGIGDGETSPVISILRKLVKLNDKSFNRITQAAREAILAAQLPSIMELQRDMEFQLEALEGLSALGAERETAINQLVAGLSYHMDVLPMFFTHKKQSLRLLSIEIYIKRVFEAFDFTATNIDDNCFSWTVDAPPALTKQSKTTSPSLAEYHRRSGVFAAFNDAADLQNGFDAVIERLALEEATKNVVYLAIPDKNFDNSSFLAEWTPFIKSKGNCLSSRGVKRLTIILVRSHSTSMGCYTFRELLGWEEDCHVRNMEPAMSYLLELPRITHNYTIKLYHADATGQIHIYKASPIGNSGPSRLFIRVHIRQTALVKGHYSLTNLTSDARTIFSELLDAVAMVQAQQSKPFDCNHLYINILPTFFSESKIMANMFLSLMAASEEKLLKARIMEGEIRMNLAMRRGEAPERYRFFLWNETGFVNRVAVYKEIRTVEEEPPCLITQHDHKDALHLNNTVANAPHPLPSRLQVKRNRAHALETSYVYDFPAIFRRAAELAWEEGAGKQCPEDYFSSTELILQTDGTLKESSRSIGENDIGMVAWKLAIKTPMHANGRIVIMIANDIDFEIGSFGIKEDELFAAASELARSNKWPRIFLSANSGARIGLAEELKKIVKAHWIDTAHPQLGFEYLYLEPKDYEQFGSSVKVEYIADKKHYKITDILTGLGVENLSGSALIASETSRAYTDAFTLTFVTGRSVGIGAYLVRLGQRVIQKQSQPIILTGVQALNQLLGRDVYSSNLQIGGPQIMAANGVSHLVVRTDLEGAQSAIKWLDFVKVHDPKLPLSPITSPSFSVTDDPDRPIAYHPSSEITQDPRLLVTGSETAEGIFLGGFLDRGSFVEYQAAWARSVIVGRGLLGGLPVAILLVETRTTQTLIPADPASPSSELLTIPQAGQVWYPDSAYKTAQFIKDCNYGERLPLIIMANWRGFSGGQRDLFDEILKFGSYIVDALREYQPPVFVYLPPGAQLRGGSWVVVDTAINPRRIEMYADPSARGGIMEAEGLVAIKFKGQQLRDLVHRLIPEASLLTKAEQDKFIPLVHRVACSFADLHDRPGRMLELGIIKSVVPWRDARRYFYYRLCVRLWTIRILERAAHLCDIKISDMDSMNDLYDDLCEIIKSEWLPTMLIDSQICTNEEIASAMNKNHELLEQKLIEWCRTRLIRRMAKLLDVYQDPEEKGSLLEKLLSSTSERARSISPNR